MQNKVLNIVFLLLLVGLYFLSPGRFNINLILNHTLLFGMLYVSVIYYLLQESLNSRISFQLKRYMVSLYDMRFFFVLYFAINLVFSSRYIAFYGASYFNQFTLNWFSEYFYYSRQLVYLVLVISSLYYIKLKRSPEVLFNYLFLFLLSFLFIIYSYDLLAYVQDITIREFWQSTIWVFYLFISLLTLLFSVLLLTSYFLKTDNSEGYISNLATQLFGFNIFWSYLFFCQIIIVYYANIPSESFLFNIRFTPPWLLYQGLVMLLHLLIPSIFLFTKKAKKSKGNILIASYSTIMAVALDVMCYFIPAYSINGISIFEYTFFIFSFGGFVIIYLNRLSKYKKVQVFTDNSYNDNNTNNIDSDEEN